MWIFVQEILRQINFACRYMFLINLLYLRFNTSSFEGEKGEGGMLFNTKFSLVMLIKWVQVMVMVFNATFNNISVISWRSVLLPEKCGGPGENHWPAASHWQTLSEETGVPGENHRPVASHWHKGNWCTRRKPQTCHKSLTNFITLGNRSTRKKTTDLPQITNKLYLNWMELL